MYFTLPPHPKQISHDTTWTTMGAEGKNWGRGVIMTVAGITGWRPQLSSWPRIMQQSTKSKNGTNTSIFFLLPTWIKTATTPPATMIGAEGKYWGRGGAEWAWRLLLLSSRPKIMQQLSWNWCFLQKMKIEQQDIWQTTFCQHFV